MPTFHQWLADQVRRGDHVGHLARLWVSYEHPRLSGLASVTRNLRERAQLIAVNPSVTGNWQGPSGPDWIEPAIAAATAEYRSGKAPTPEAVAEGNTRLAGLEEMLQMVLRGQQMIMAALGIEQPASTAEVFTAAVQAARDYDAGTISSQLSEGDFPDGWQELYELADHTAEPEA